MSATRFMVACACLSFAALVWVPGASAGGSAELEVSVEKTGDGQGNVSSDFGGIDCGRRCRAEVPPQFALNLTARPDDGSEFKEWQNAPGCRTDPVCRVEVRFDSVKVTAVFEKKKGQSNKPDVGCLSRWAKDGSGALELRRKPRRCDFHVHDGHSPILRLSVIPTAGVHWKHWGRTSAYGRGRVHVSSAGFKKARIWLSRPREVCGSLVFTRAQIRLDVIGKRGSRVAIAGCPSG